MSDSDKPNSTSSEQTTSSSSPKEEKSPEQKVEKVLALLNCIKDGSFDDTTQKINDELFKKIVNIMEFLLKENTDQPFLEKHLNFVQCLLTNSVFHDETKDNLKKYVDFIQSLTKEQLNGEIKKESISVDDSGKITLSKQPPSTTEEPANTSSSSSSVLPDLSKVFNFGKQETTENKQEPPVKQGGKKKRSMKSKNKNNKTKKRCCKKYGF